MTSTADANEMVQNLVVTLTSAINLYSELASQEIAEGTEGTRKIVRDMRSEIDTLVALNHDLTARNLELVNQGKEANQKVTELNYAIKQLHQQSDERTAEIDRLEKLRTTEIDTHGKLEGKLRQEVARLQGEWDAALVVNERLAKENARLRQVRQVGGSSLPVGAEAFEEYVQLKNIAMAARSLIEAEAGTVEEELADAELERYVEALLAWYQNHPDYQS